MPDFVDRCPTSLEDLVTEDKLGKKWRYADLDGDGVFETKQRKKEKVCKTITIGCGKRKKTKEFCHWKWTWEVVDSEYTLDDTFGCTCYDILEVKKGKDRISKKIGCSKKVMKDWINTKGSAITRAK